MSRNSYSRLAFECVLALVLGAVFAFVVAVGPFVLADQDVAWHTETGRWILTHWNVPRTDPFSWTAAGQPWIDNEWLAQVVMALAAELFGWHGLVALDASLWVALVALQEHYIRIALYATDAGIVTDKLLAAEITQPSSAPDYRKGGFRTGAIPVLLAVGVMWFASFHGQMRPHMFALVCLTVWTGELCRAYKHSFMSRAGLVALFLVWVQLHGSALVLGPFVALMLGHWRIALACLPMGVVNPYGYGYYEMVWWQHEHFSIMQAHIAELRPVNAATDFWRLAVLGIFVFAALATGARLPLARTVLVLALAGAGFLAWRGLAFFAVVAPVVVVSSPWFREQSLWLYWQASTYRLRRTSRQRAPIDRLRPWTTPSITELSRAASTTITTSADT